MPDPPKLQQLVRQTCQTRHLSRRTAKTYWGWIKRFVVFHDLQHPSKLNAADVNAFLSHLAVERNVAASTQDQAKNAVVFLFRDVLNIRLGDFGDITKAKRPKRLPVVLSRPEALTILSLLDGTAALACGLLYGAGLRVEVSASKQRTVGRSSGGLASNVTHRIATLGTKERKLDRNLHLDVASSSTDCAR